MKRKIGSSEVGDALIIALIILGMVVALLICVYADDRNDQVKTGDLSDEISETINVSTAEEKRVIRAISPVLGVLDDPVIETGVCETPTPAGEWITYWATAYCPNACCCGEWASIAYKATASGAGAVEGRTIAMGESYPFGTHIYIEDMGEYVVEDRGSAIDDGRIDIYFEHHEDACAFGMRQVRAKVIGD